MISATFIEGSDGLTGKLTSNYRRLRLWRHRNRFRCKTAPGRTIEVENRLHSAPPCLHCSCVASTQLTFSDREAHRAWLARQARLPAGFRVGTHRFEFMPIEAHKPAKMTLTLIALDEPTPDFAAVFTRNAFPGAPILVGRKRLGTAKLGAILVNNKILKLLLKFKGNKWLLH